MIFQRVISRKCRQVDEGCIGFRDYVSQYEPFGEFVYNVSKEANVICSDSLSKVLSISYPNTEMAIITYEQFSESEKANPTSEE